LLLAYVNSVAAGTYAVDLSDDGGQSWRPLALPALTGNQLRFAFAGPENGWLLDCRADSIREVPEAAWRTTDGGRSWSRLPTPDLPGLGSLADLRFVDADRGVLAVTQAGVAATVLLATEDGGVTWRPVAELDVPPPRPAYLNVELASAGPRVLAVLEAFNGPSPPSQVYTAASADGGQTWTSLRAGPLTGVSSVPGVRGADRLMVFDGLRLWSSADGGVSWAVRPARLPDALKPIGAVSGGQGTLFVLAGDVSPTGRFNGQRSLLRSADGGVHWAPLALPRPRPRPVG